MEKCRKESPELYENLKRYIQKKRTVSKMRSPQKLLGYLQFQFSGIVPKLLKLIVRL